MDDAPGSLLRAETFTTRPRIAALADAAQRRPIVVLLGMHRSGTSLCSNVLSVLGGDMADEIGVNQGNDRGHWERLEIVGFHDRILELFNRGYFGGLHDFPLPAGWWADPRVSKIREEVVGFLKGRMNDAPFGFKDPRTVRLLPLWRQIFAELRLSPRFVFCVRNPAQVARSLHERDGLDALIAEYRWLVYTIDFFRYIGNNEFSIIEYEDWFANTAKNTRILENVLSLEVGYPRSEIEHALTDIIDPQLRHDGEVAREAKDPFVRQVYHLARVASGDPQARGRLQELVSQFISIGRLHRGFYHEFESISAVAARLPGAASEIETLRNAAAESAAALEVANARSGAAGDALSQARAEMEAERESTAGRGAAAEQAIAESRAELEATRGRLIEVEAERDTAVVRFSSAEQVIAEAHAELEATRARLTELETERDAAIASAEQAVAGATAETANFRDRLAEIEDERNVATVRAEQAVTEASSESEAARARLAEAEAERDAFAARAEAAEEALARVGVEVDVLLARLNEIEADRDAMARSSQAAGEAVETARVAAADAGRNLAEVEARLTSREAKLSQLLQEREQADIASERSTALLEEQIVALEAEGTERRAAGERLEQELSLIQALADQRLASFNTAKAEAAQAERERAAEAEELRRQVAAVSAELAAARRIGAAMLAALRDPPVPVPAPPPRERWWAVVWRGRVSRAGRHRV